MQAMYHQLVEESVVKGKHDHALVVSHVGTHDGKLFAHLQSLGREIHRFIHAVQSPCFMFLKPGQVL
jgi:hypothetical protein